MKLRALTQTSLILIFLMQTHCASRQTAPAPQNPNDTRSAEAALPTYKIEIKSSIKPELPPPQESQPESAPETESKPTRDDTHPARPLPEPIPIPLDRLED